MHSKTNPGWVFPLEVPQPRLPRSARAPVWGSACTARPRAQLCPGCSSQHSSCCSSSATLQPQLPSCSTADRDTRRHQDTEIPQFHPGQDSCYEFLSWAQPHKQMPVSGRAGALRSRNSSSLAHTHSPQHSQALPTYCYNTCCSWDIHIKSLSSSPVHRNPRLICRRAFILSHRTQ